MRVDNLTIEQRYRLTIRKKRITIMRQMYHCPNCGARLVCGERFCVNCGINLKWVVQQVLPDSSPPSCGYQCHTQEQTYGQQEPEHNQQPEGYQKPISDEILKLLADLFGKHIKYGTKV